MYILMMEYAQDAWDAGIASCEADRYLQYTDDGIKARFKPVTDEVIQQLKTLPVLFTYEKQTEAKPPARVGWVKSIQRLGGEVRASFEFDAEIPPIEQDQISKILVDLNIDHKFEVNRSHWAIKDIDLIAVLRRFKIIGAQTGLSPSAFRFSRQTVIKACDLLRSLGHAGFDALLLDIGLTGIGAGRDKGSLLARSVVLGTYAVDHMDDETTDGEPMAYALVKRAAEYDADFSETDDSVDPRHKAFWSSLRRDGYRHEAGRLLPLDEETTQTHRPYALHPNPEKPAMTAQIPSTAAAVAAKPRVFIVHGRDAALKTEVARFLERLGTEAVILHERPNGGRTLITKFQEESADIAFAIVLMTPDDVGGLAGASQNPRARQNVIFELGFFIGKLGAAKVCALVQGNVEKPSDFDAVVYVSHDTAGAWKTEIARELKHANVPFNAEALLG